MPDAAPNPFQPMDRTPPSGDNADGRPSLSASEIARNAARQAIEGADAPPRQPNTMQPGSTFREGGPSANREPAPQEPSQQPSQPQQPQEGGEDGQGAQNAPQQPQQPSQPNVPHVTAADLEAHGIELPISPDEVPEEFRPAYDRLAQTVIDSRSRAEQVETDARQAIAQVQDFSRRLQTPEGQKRMLLTMALTASETFEEVINEYTRMTEDPQYAEAVRRGLEAEARLEAAERKERVINERETSRYAQQVEGRTERLARQMGVDVEWAKQEVVNRILRNEAERGQRHITLQEVDEVVKAVARRSGATPPPPRTPAQQQQHQQAPQQPAQGAGSQPTQHQQAAQPQQHATQSDSHPVDRLRAAVRDAARRHGADQTR